MMRTFLRDRLRHGSLRERRLVFLEFSQHENTYVPAEGDKARREELNPTGIDRNGYEVNGLDEMINVTQRRFDAVNKQAGAESRTQIFEIQKTLQVDCAKNTQPELAAKYGLPLLTKRQWVDQANADLESRGANYRVSMINDTVVPKPAPTVTQPKNEGMPAAPTLAAQDTVPPAGRGAMFSIEDKIPAEGGSVVANAEAMIAGREAVNMTEKQRNTLMGEIMMRTGAGVEVKDNKFVITPPASEFEKAMNGLAGAVQFIDAVFTKENGERIKLNPSSTEEQRREKMNKVVDKNDPAADKAFEDALKKDVTETAASVEKLQEESAYLLAHPEVPSRDANLATNERVLAAKRQKLADLQADVQTFQTLLKERAARPDWVKKLPSEAQQAFMKRDTWIFVDNDRAKGGYHMSKAGQLDHYRTDGTYEYFDATPGVENWKQFNAAPKTASLPDWVQKLPADAQFAFNNRNVWKYVNDDPKNVGYRMNDNGVLTQRFSNGREDYYDATPGVEKWKPWKPATPEKNLTPEKIKSIGLDNIQSMGVNPDEQSDGTYILDLPNTVWDFEFKFNGKSWEWRVEDGTWNSADTSVGNVAEANWDPAAKNQAVNFQVALRQANKGYSLRKK